MTLTLNSEQEQLVREELRTGQYQSPEEVISRALEALREQERGALARKRDPRRAATRIRERRKGVRLGDITIRELVNEGRR
jgi:Arc/MetJ-type ribon-helix-helix transcriptional regulator